MDNISKLPNLFRLREAGVAGVLILELLLFAVLVRSFSGGGEWLFVRKANLLDILVDAAVIGIATVGVTLVIIAGGIDLSVGGVIALASVVAAGLLRAEWPLLIVLPLTILSGLIIGAINAALVTLVELPSFIATLATMLIARGVAFLFTRGDNWTIAAAPAFTDGFGNGGLLIPYPAMVLLAVVALFAFLMARSTWGRQVFAVGGNEVAARYAGVAVSKIQWSVYLLSGALAALAGLVYSAKYGVGQSLAADGYELDAVAAAVVGGASLSGGRGSIAGAALGAVIFAALRKGLNQISGGADYERVIIGGVVIAAVIVDRVIQRRLAASNQ